MVLFLWIYCYIILGSKEKCNINIKQPIYFTEPPYRTLNSEHPFLLTQIFEEIVPSCLKTLKTLKRKLFWFLWTVYSKFTPLASADLDIEPPPPPNWYSTTARQDACALRCFCRVKQTHSRTSLAAIYVYTAWNTVVGYLPTAVNNSIREAWLFQGWTILKFVSFWLFWVHWRHTFYSLVLPD